VNAYFPLTLHASQRNAVGTKILCRFHDRPHANHSPGIPFIAGGYVSIGPRRNINQGFICREAPYVSRKVGRINHLGIIDGANINFISAQQILEIPKLKRIVENFQRDGVQRALVQVNQPT
jgi:hypothetical protein